MTTKSTKSNSDGTYTKTTHYPGGSGESTTYKPAGHVFGFDRIVEHKTWSGRK